MAAAANRPLVIVFLGITGVLTLPRRKEGRAQEIHAILRRLFKEKQDSEAPDLIAGFTKLEWRIAASYCFSNQAVANLKKLVEKVAAVAEVRFVLSSSARNDATLEEIQNLMFPQHFFSKFIIDKTPQEDHVRENNQQKPLSPVALKKYGFDLKNRGKQIDFWLREHADLNIAGYVILDNEDKGISQRFPTHFVKTDENTLFSESDIETAREILTRSLPQKPVQKKDTACCLIC